MTKHTETYSQHRQVVVIKHFGVHDTDFRLLRTFDAVIIHHSQAGLIKSLKNAQPANESLIYPLDKDILQSRMIASPVLVALNEKSIALIEEHLQICAIADQPHGLYTLLDYLSPADRAKKTRASGQEFLPTYHDWQCWSAPQQAMSEQSQSSTINMVRIARTLANHQIIHIGSQVKHFRYLDPQVMIHLIALQQYYDIAKRHAYPQRMWIVLDKEWHELEGIHQHIPSQHDYSQYAPDYCALTTQQLSTINTINCFFAKNGVEGNGLILNYYPKLLAWVDQATERLRKMPELTNPVDRTLVLNRWLWEYYEQSGLMADDTKTSNI